MLVADATSREKILRDIAFCKTRLPEPKPSANDISQILQVRHRCISTLGAKELETLFKSMAKDARRADILRWAMELDDEEVARRSDDIERELRAVRGAGGRSE